MAQLALTFKFIWEFKSVTQSNLIPTCDTYEILPQIASQSSGTQTFWLENPPQELHLKQDNTKCNTVETCSPDFQYRYQNYTFSVPNFEKQMCLHKPPFTEKEAKVVKCQVCL